LGRNSNRETACSAKRNLKARSMTGKTAEIFTINGGRRKGTILWRMGEGKTTFRVVKKEKSPEEFETHKGTQKREKTTS